MNLAFHGTFGSGEPGWQHPLSCTITQLDWLVRNLWALGYEIVTCAEYARRNDRYNLATLSFDDGYRNNINAAKTLESLGIRGTFFPIACTLRGELPPNRRLTMAMDMHSDQAIAQWFHQQLQGTYHAQFVFNESWEAPGPFYNDSGLRRRVKTIWNCLLPRHDLLYLSNALKQQFLEDINERTICESIFLTSDDLRILIAAEHEVGTHTEHHLLLHSQCEENVRAEISHSVAILTETLGKPITSLCIPYGGTQVPNHIIDIAAERNLSGWNYWERCAYEDAVVTDFGLGFFNRADHSLFRKLIGKSS